MTETLTTALEVAKTTPKQRTVLDLIARQKPEVEKLLPTGVSFERFERVCRTELRRTPALLDCSPESLLGALMLSAQLGLEPGPLGHVYFVPYKGECVWILGYRGMVELGYRSGLVKSVSAVTVYEGDEFYYRQGTRPVIDHTPAGPPGDRAATHWYAVAELRTGGKPFVVLYPEDVEKAKKRSAAGVKGAGPWVTDYDAMARKTAVRRLAKLLPQSPQLAQGLARDDQPVEFDAEGDLVSVDEAVEGGDGDA
jgi:recombination protein RecT